MQIFSLPLINNKPTTSKKSPSFQKLDQFTSIKQIEGITCACCGEKVLSANKYAQTITNLSKSLHIAMRKGNLNFVKALFPESWKLLIDFTYKYPNKSLDEIMENSVDYTLLKRTIVNKLDKPELAPQTPERLELDREISKTFFNILAKGRSNMKESAIVMDTVAHLKPLLKGKSKELFELFENYSKTYPDKTLSEIVNEVYEYHAEKGNQFRENNLKLINEKFNAIKKIADSSGANITDKLNDIQEEIMKMYNNDEDGIQYRIHEIKKMYNKILKKNKCGYLFHDIMRQIKDLPPTLENIDTFIKRARENNYTDAKILFSMFCSIYSSEEKIVSLKTNGTNKIGNKIVMCNHCVKLRKNSIFNSFVQVHPEMIENTQKQMNIIMNEILAKNLDGNFRFYPLIIAHRLKETTNGTINLNIVSFCRQILEESNSKIQNLKAELEKYISNREEKRASIMQYPTLESDFMREISRINSKMEKIQKQIDTELSLQTHINNYLESWNNA